MQRLLAGAVACVPILFGAANAAAATRYVEMSGVDGTPCTDPGAPCATVHHAVSVADSGDTIQIGPGDFLGSLLVTGKKLTLTGSGPSTVIRGLDGAMGVSGMPGLMFAAPGGAIRSLRVEGGTGGAAIGPTGANGGMAIAVNSITPTTLEIENVEAVGGGGGPGGTIGAGGTALWAAAGQPLKVDARKSNFAEGSGGLASIAAVYVGTETEATLSESTISGASGLNVGGGGSAALVNSSSIDADYGAVVTGGKLWVYRSRIRAEVQGLQLYAETANPVAAGVADSIVRSNTSSTAQLFSGGAGGAVSLEVRGSTLVNVAGDHVVEAIEEPAKGPVTVALHNSIARRLAGSASPDLLAMRSEVTAATSNFASSKALLDGSVPAPGSGTNTTADPLFVDAAGGNFALLPASPLIDVGDPAMILPGELDVTGAPRSLDGNRDCVAAPDVGAFELTGHECPPPDAAPAVSGFGLSNRRFAPKGAAKKRRGKGARSSAKRKQAVKRGTKFRYTLSEPARVAITIERVRPKSKGKRRFAKVGTLRGAGKAAGRQATKFSGRLRGKPLKPGRYRATIVATDGGGQASAPRRAGFRVVRG